MSWTRLPRSLVMSRASRSCGLKFPSRALPHPSLVPSRASRSCGLKCYGTCTICNRYCVTSFTLVWIKIVNPSSMRLISPVTSFTLVWIKIYNHCSIILGRGSRASRSCGLKCDRTHRHRHTCWSRASRSCGLKLGNEDQQTGLSTSRASRSCGLK